MLRTVSSIALLLVPSLSLAQAAGLEVGLGAARGDTTSWARSGLFRTSLDLSRRFGYASFDATVASNDRRVGLRDASVSVASRLLSAGPFQLSANLEGSRGSVAGIDHEYRGGAGLGASARFGSAGSFVTAGRRSGRTSELGIGAWKSLGGSLVAVTRRYSFATNSRVGSQALGATLGVSSAVDSVPVISPSPGQSNSSENSKFEKWTETEARMDMSAGRLHIQALIASRGRNGHPDSTFSTQWGRLDVAARIDSRWSIIGGGGSVPVTAGPGSRTRRFLSFGLRVSPRGVVREHMPVVVRPAAAAFSLHAEGEGTHRIRLLVPGARTVMLSGDFTEWRPVTLREASPGVWEVTLPVSSGVHHVSVSVNGESWTAPAGLPSVEDEFNGGARVGVIVVK